MTRIAGKLYAACEDLVKLYYREDVNRNGHLERKAFHVDLESWQTILAMEGMGIGSAVAMIGNGMMTWQNIPVLTLHTKLLRPFPASRGQSPISQTSIEDYGMPQVLTIECFDQRNKRVVYINHPDNPPLYL